MKAWLRRAARRGWRLIRGELLPGSQQVKGPAYWRDLRNHSTEWDARTSRPSQLLKDDWSVFEFGAGRRALKAKLDAGIDYGHHDICRRDDETVVFDLNSKRYPDIGNYQTALFSGVLEYIANLPYFLTWVAVIFDAAVCSYATRELSGSLRDRHQLGWRNHFTKDDFIVLWTRLGFRREECERFGGNQYLFRFSKGMGKTVQKASRER